ncbi:Signal recognition particle receptor FtsY, partial [Haemophilus influenzae]
SYLMRLWV